ncbi:MAG: hypothetical protein H7288_07605, partial [Kineosporiaceae bacterium]|nr:hypothetical protein [Aeromicrobium sp.]
MSRPTNDSKFHEADSWMVETFGQGMQDYLRSDSDEPVSVAVMEVDRTLRKAGVRKLLEGWQSADAKTTAGRHCVISANGVLGLILLQQRLRRPT